MPHLRPVRRFRRAVGVPRAVGAGLVLLACAVLGSARTLSTRALQPSPAHSAASRAISPQVYIARLLNGVSPGGESPTDGVIPTSPTLLSHTQRQYGGGFGLTIVDQRAYVTGRALQILDIHDPTTPTLIGEYQPPSEIVDVNNVQVVGALEYIVTTTGLEILDIHDPTHPTVLGQYMVGNRVMDVQVIGRVAYLAAADNGLYAIDVHDPAAPTLLHRFEGADTAFDSDTGDNRLYVADFMGGLMIFTLDKT